MREKERILSVSCTNDVTKFMKIMPIIMTVKKGGMNRFKNLGFQTLQQRKGTSWIDITGCANFVLAIKFIEKAPRFEEIISSKFSVLKIWFFFIV